MRTPPPGPPSPAPDPEVWRQGPDGYRAASVFPAYFHRELQPLWLTTIARLQGHAAAELQGGFRYVELGCGQGLGLLVAAALQPQGRFLGLDVNPRAIAQARQAAHEIGLDNLTFVQADLADPAAVRALPDEACDFLVCHGTWSWVGPRVRETIATLAATRLAPHGLFHLHYLCHPGSTALQPVQQLFAQIAAQPGLPADEALRQGLVLVRQLSDSGLFDHQPELHQRLASLSGIDRADLVHDLLAGTWQVEHAVRLHAQLAQRGLAFIGSARAFDNLDPELSVPLELQPLLAAQADPALRETLKDLARGQRQRLDLFQPAGRRPGTSVPAWAALAWTGLPDDPVPAVPAVPAVPDARTERSDDTRGLVCATPIGPLQMPAGLGQALLRALAPGQRRTGAQLLALPEVAGDVHGLHQALQLLMQAGRIHPAAAVPTGAATLVPHDRPVAALSRWLQARGWRLRLIPAAATARLLPLRPSVPGVVPGHQAPHGQA
ncbi:MAG: hypothetical protein RLY78_3013 [Pseudomonadota bacterium]|jgi:SAM-dependent methyltransferase